MARFVKLFVLLALMLPLMALGGPPAEAQASNNCPSGDIVDGDCSIDHGPPTCPDGYELETDEVCLKLEEPVIDVSCPEGTLGEPGDCHLFVDPVLVPTCEIGELVEDSCAISEPAPVNCPDGYEAEPSLGGICARFELADQAPPSCPDGARGEPGDCYILVARGPRIAVCELGDLVRGNCVIQGADPVQGEPSCPVSAVVFLDGDRCFEIVEPLEDDTCPDLGILNDSGLCEVPFPLRPGALMCEADFGLVDGACIQYEDPQYLEAECPAGSTEDEAGDCRKPVGDAAGAFFCEDEDAALNGASCIYTIGFEFGPCEAEAVLDGSSCITLFPPSLELDCPPLSTFENVEVCRQAVADAASEPYCVDEAAELTERGCELRVYGECELGELVGSCLEFFPVDYFCGDELVTINMQLGDPGTGTAGNDVILGTNGPDKIDAGAGDDIVCALSGDDTVSGGSGADLIYGNGGGDFIRGGAGDDKIAGGTGDDDIGGGGGNDRLYGQDGNDDVSGGNGRDALRGGDGDDDLRGGNDKDRIKGQAGNDTLRGGDGKDRCDGGEDVDTADASCESLIGIP